MMDCTATEANADRAAILAVLSAETDAYLRRDIDALSAHWIHSPQARRMHSISSMGTFVVEGWEAIRTQIQNAMESSPQKYDINERINWERMNVVVCGDMAWVTYDQVGVSNGDDFEMAGVQHELKIFQRVGGQWRIACIVVMERGTDHENCPLIEVAPDGKALWINSVAQVQLTNHPALIVSGGRLRTRSKTGANALQDAITWGYLQLKAHFAATSSFRPARAVILGEDASAAPVFCWVILRDAKVFVSFDDERTLERRIAVARPIYGLSATQARLAQLIAQGNDLPQAAAQLVVSVNTVRTHLQRMFDRTGAHSQSALISLLLTAEPPAGR